MQNIAVLSNLVARIYDTLPLAEDLNLYSLSDLTMHLYFVLVVAW